MACIKRRRNRWVVDFRDQHGTRRWKSFTKRKQADAYLAKTVPQVQQHTYLAPEQAPTFGEAADRFLAAHHDRAVATVSTYTSHVERHLRPVLGTLRLNAIGQTQLDTLKEALREKGLGTAMVNKLLTTASSIFKFGMARNYCATNPVAVMERAYAPREVAMTDDDEPVSTEDDAVDPQEVITGEEMQRLIAAAPAGFDRVFLQTMCLTAARIGEITALRWRDIDFDRGRLRIRASLSWAKPYGQKEPATPRFVLPKTPKSKRTLRMSPALVSALKRWRLECPKSAFDLVFCTAVGRPMYRSTLNRLVLKPALAAAKLPPLSLHALRHSAASAMLAAGVPLPAVSRYLGHEDVGITAKTYSHWCERDGTEPMKILSEAMDGSKTVAAGPTDQALSA